MKSSPGFGRTGEWFAHQHFGIEPDIMTLAKALTAGYAPMGAIMTKAEIADALDIFLHLHTFSGHLAAVAAANTDDCYLRARELDHACSRQRRLLPRCPEN